MLFVQHFTALSCLTARKDRVRSGAHVVSPYDAVNLLVLVHVNPQVTEQVPKASRLLQDSYLHQFGGSGKNSKGVKETLARHPLRSRALEPWFHALSYVVDIAPAQAHAIVSQHASLGQLMAIYADPSRCSHVLYVSVIQRPCFMSGALKSSQPWMHALGYVLAACLPRRMLLSSCRELPRPACGHKVDPPM